MDHFVIAITRTCGSGATSIGRILAKNLGVELYDRNILRLASDDSGISEELFARADEDQKQSLLFRASQKVYTGGLIPPEKEDFTSNNNLFNYQAKVLRELADESSYVVIGRAADYVLRDRRDVVKIFIHASREYRIGRAMEVYGDTREEAEENIRRSDRARAAYYHHISGRRWGEAANYDLTVDSSRGVPQAAEEILRYLEANGLADLQSVR